MTQEQIELRRQRAREDIFVITKAEQGWHVRSARTPSKFYLVSANGAGLHCSCPDFESHIADDPGWQCKHILAVHSKQPGNGMATDQQTDRQLAEERAAIQAENSGHAETANPEAAQMLIKRSLSPDGRIDSISIEFSFPLVETDSNHTKERALSALRLQTEIVKGFLNGTSSNKNGRPSEPQTQYANNGRQNFVSARQPHVLQANGVVFARLLDVGVTNGQYGERFYLNVNVNGRTARFFGSAAQIAQAITVAGETIYEKAIEPGMRLNLPCRVLTEKSRDGRYVNVKRVLPLAGQGNGGQRQ